MPNSLLPFTSHTSFTGTTTTLGPGFETSSVLAPSTSVPVFATSSITDYETIWHGEGSYATYLPIVGDSSVDTHLSPSFQEQSNPQINKEQFDKLLLEVSGLESKSELDSNLAPKEKRQIQQIITHVKGILATIGLPVSAKDIYAANIDGIPWGNIWASVWTSRYIIFGEVFFMADVIWKLIVVAIEWNIGERLIVLGSTRGAQLYTILSEMHYTVVREYMTEHNMDWEGIDTLMHDSVHKFHYLNNGDYIKDFYDWPRVDEMREMGSTLRLPGFDLTLSLKMTDEIITLAITYEQTMNPDSKFGRRSVYRSVKLCKRQETLAVENHALGVMTGLHDDVLMSHEGISGYIASNGVEDHDWFLKTFMDPRGKVFDIDPRKVTEVLPKPGV